MGIIEDVDEVLEKAKKEAREKLGRRLQKLDQQIEPLDRERRRLRARIAELDGTRGGAPAAAGGRMTREQRHAQVLELVDAERDLSAADIARRIGVSENRARDVVSELREAGALAPGLPLRRAAGPAAPGVPTVADPAGGLEAP